MLDEVINYLKQLQAQIQIMNMTNLPQMMVPLAMQQQLQMSMQLARIGAMGMVNMNHLVRPTSIMMPASLVQARAPASSNPEPSSSGINASIPLPNPYCANLTQVCDLFKRMLPNGDCWSQINHFQQFTKHTLFKS